jgi:hypothetical protein
MANCGLYVEGRYQTDQQFIHEFKGEVNDEMKW